MNTFCFNLDLINIIFGKDISQKKNLQYLFRLNSNKINHLEWRLYVTFQMNILYIC